MQPRIPRQSAREQGIHRADNDARLDAELAAVIAGARRRALRDGDRHIDTAHLLHSLLESDPEARAVFGDGPQIARLFGYLVQRSIGYGLRWQGTVEDSGAIPVVPAVEGWSPLAADALEYACERAELRDGDLARGIDLLAAIVADPESRAVEVLHRAGIESPEVLIWIEGRLDEYVRGGETGC
ncbi:Clp protease N-terminal domain-containing protein [Streptomyces sp. NPDC091219]|uniref:Clp protease N-terminal domain-containing protein n=1 Tax=Streptomyces sp. NPDC091219 TaxID=3155193 RepID=UPI00344BC522